jgi:hypothetical protein
MNSRPAETALDALLKAPVAAVHAAIRIQPSGGWSYQ